MVWIKPFSDIIASHSSMRQKGPAVLPASYKQGNLDPTGKVNYQSCICDVSSKSWAYNSTRLSNFKARALMDCFCSILTIKVILAFYYFLCNCSF